MSAPVDAGTQFARIIMKAESGSYKTVFRKQERIKQNHIVQLHRTAEQHRMLHQMPKMYEKVQYKIPGKIKKHQIFRMLQKENVL